MENKKTNVKPQMKGGPRGRGMRHTTERAKDVKGSLGKLIKYLKPFYISICICMIGEITNFGIQSSCTIQSSNE